MVYHDEGGHWIVGQKKSLEYYYTPGTAIKPSPAARLDKIVCSLKPIGPTILVEWSK